MIFVDAVIAVTGSGSSLAAVIGYPVANGGGVALVGLASGCHVLGQPLDVLLPDGREVSLQFRQFISRQKNILIASINCAGAYSLSIL